MSGNVLLHLHGKVCTVAVEFLAHCLAQGPIVLFEGSVPLGNQLSIVRRTTMPAWLRLLLQNINDACELCCQIHGDVVINTVRGQRCAGIVLRSRCPCRCSRVRQCREAKCRNQKSRTPSHLSSHSPPSKQQGS